MALVISYLSRSGAMNWRPACRNSRTRWSDSSESCLPSRRRIRFASLQTNEGFEELGIALFPPFVNQLLPIDVLELVAKVSEYALSGQHMLPRIFPRFRCK